jgi:two-component system cell cycle response regulator CpdR
LLRFLKLVLKNQGWELIVTSSGVEAVSIAASRPLDLALIDYMLPDLDGLAVAKNLKHRQPSTEIILMTGGGQMSINEKSGLNTSVPILQKPFLIKELLDLMTSRLEAHDRSAAVSAG